MQSVGRAEANITISSVTPSGSIISLFGPMFFRESAREQELTALHELGHATGAAAATHYEAPQNATKAQLDRQDRETKAYNNKIRKACF